MLYKVLFQLLQVLRDQGLGKYCDPEFVRAASREMQEAMDMTAEEFDEAAHRLLEAENEGQIRLSSGLNDAGEEDVEDAEADDERTPLRPRVPPARFILPERLPDDAGGNAGGGSGPRAPNRKNRSKRGSGGGGGGPGSAGGFADTSV